MYRLHNHPCQSALAGASLSSSVYQRYVASAVPDTIEVPVPTRASELIRTVRGEGYMFVPAVTRASKAGWAAPALGKTPNGWGENIAPQPDGFYEFTVRPFPFELLPDTADMHIDASVHGACGTAVRELEQLVAGKNYARALAKGREQIEFGGCKRHGQTLRTKQLSLGRNDTPTAEFIMLCRSCTAKLHSIPLHAPRQRPQARYQLPHPDGFCYIVVSTRL